MASSKVLVITGASSGIGAATARLAAGRGWHVALLARRRAELESLATELGDGARSYPCDVTAYPALESAIESAVNDFGAVDAVFANAGRGIGSGGYTGGDPDDWQDLVAVNVLGLMYTIRASAAALIERRGRLVINSSIAGRRIIKGSVYGGTKWAACGIGYNAREELAEHGVSVTLLEPGMVDTPFFDDPRPDALRPDDVAEAVLFALERPQSVALPELMIVPNRPFR